MNINLLSPSPFAFRAVQNALYSKNSLQRKAQGYPFPIQGAVTVSNINGATTHSISNYTSFLFCTGGPASPVINRDNVNWLSGIPSMMFNSYPGYTLVSSPYPTGQSGYGQLTFECIVDSTAFELGIYQAGGITTVVVDEQVVYVTSGTQPRTAQAGAASTITLYSGSSSTDRTYNNMYVYIASGTGVGQIRRISSYVGSTKVATVSSAWSTNPDATSVYVLGYSPSVLDSTYAAGGILFPKFTFAGERTSHVVRVYSGNPLSGIYVDSSGSVRKPVNAQRPKLFIVGDSFAEGTGMADFSSSYPQVLARNLGMDVISSSVGSTGMTTNGGKTSYKERTCPPTNAWHLFLGSPSGGTFTLTQGAITTNAIAYNATVANIQTELDTSFGSGMWRAVTVNTWGSVKCLLLGLSTNADVSSSLVLNSGSLTGTLYNPGTLHYDGDITPNVPVDGFGSPLPFYIFVQGSINDVNNYATLSSAASDLYASLAAKFPTAIIIGSGTVMSYGSVSGNWLLAESALETAGATLQKINGKSAFFPLFNSSTGVGYLTSGGENSGGASTYKMTNQNGTAGYNVDQYVWSDGVHPSQWGHIYLADVLTESISNILSV